MMSLKQLSAPLNESRKKNKQELSLSDVDSNTQQLIYLGLKFEPTSRQALMNHSVIHGQTTKIQKVTLQNMSDRREISAKKRFIVMWQRWMNAASPNAWLQWMHSIKAANGSERRWMTHGGFYFTVHHGKEIRMPAGINQINPLLNSDIMTHKFARWIGRNFFPVKVFPH